MPKFKSVVVREERIEGGKTISGEVAWIPVDDAAKAHKVTEKAIQLGKYTPADPNEMQNTKKKLKDAEIEDLKRKGKIPRDSK